MVVSRTFFKCVTSYLLERCPLRVDLLLNATRIDFKERFSKTYSSVEYFIFRFPSLLNHLDINSVHDQFLSYQTMREEDISVSLMLMVVFAMLGKLSYRHYYITSNIKHNTVMFITNRITYNFISLIEVPVNIFMMYVCVN